MCARYTMRIGAQTILDLFQVAQDPDFEIRERFNVAPTDVMPVVVQNVTGPRELRAMRWGLVPSWGKSLREGVRMINARAETVFEKPAFRQAILKRRCLVVADGFYEWTVNSDAPKGKGGKTPFHITVDGGAPFAFGGIYEKWNDPETGHVVTTYSLLTCEPNELMAELHDRMPVIIPPEGYSAWLDRGATTSAAVLPWLVPYPTERMAARPVDPRVGSPAFDSPEILA